MCRMSFQLSGVISKARSDVMQTICMSLHIGPHTYLDKVLWSEWKVKLGVVVREAEDAGLVLHAVQGEGGEGRLGGGESHWQKYNKEGIETHSLDFWNKANIVNTKSKGNMDNNFDIKYCHIFEQSHTSHIIGCTPIFAHNNAGPCSLVMRICDPFAQPRQFWAMNFVS